MDGHSRVPSRTGSAVVAPNRPKEKEIDRAVSDLRNSEFRRPNQKANNPQQADWKERVGSAVSVVLAVVARLQGLREEIVKKLLDFNITRFDELDDRALSLQFAHTDYVLATKPSDHIKEQYEEGLKLRNVFHADISALALRGLVNGDALKEYTGNVGFKNDDARRAVQYIRFHENDAETIASNLYAYIGQIARRRTAPNRKT
jgi:hypothetical protein